VLSYLINSEDYGRFSIVCKSWHSVAKDQKHRHMTIVHKQFLLIGICIVVDCLMDGSPSPIERRTLV
ncbi:hypothetical protein LINGRAHAP2_LOCUS5853, partial [Linum grandiflorum]